MTHQTEINLTNVVEMFNNIVARFGPNHSPLRAEGDNSGCIYFKKDGLRLTPVCIVGVHISDLGALRGLMTEFGDASGEMCLSWSEAFWAKFEPFGLTFTEDAREFMRAVQAQQDDGVPWGKAVVNGAERFREDSQRKATESVAERLAVLREVTPVLAETPLAEWERELLGE